MNAYPKEFIELIEAYNNGSIAPIVHAHWKWDEDGMDWGLGAWVCSHCGMAFYDPDIAMDKNKRVDIWAHAKYCGCCGAMMDEEIENG